MQCLLDADVLRYEIGFSAEYKDQDGEDCIRHFDYVIEKLEQRIKEIEEECWADEPSILFLTSCKTTHKILNRRRKDEGREETSYRPNYREGIAKAKPYKGTRKKGKPFHYGNLTAWILERYPTVVAEGLEADDMLSVHQTLSKPLSTIICSRDKDLKITPGMHFSWPCGKQPQFGPVEVTELGTLELKGNKIHGTGLRFFYSQLITGDTVDNIPGLPRRGPAYASKLLDGCESEGDLFTKVAGEYEERLGDDWRDYFKEQAYLLWMVNSLDGDGEPIMWEMYDER